MGNAKHNRVVGLICASIIAHTVYAMDDDTNLKRNLKATRLADTDIAIDDLIPDSDKDAEGNVSFDFEIGFYKAEAQTGGSVLPVVTPSLAILNNLFAAELAHAIYTKHVDLFIKDAGKQVSRLDQYLFLCGKLFLKRSIRQAIKRIADQYEYIPSAIVHTALAEQSEMAVKFKNVKKAERIVQERAEKLKSFIAHRSVSNYCKVYPRWVCAYGCFAVSALVGLCWRIYKASANGTTDAQQNSDQESATISS